MSTTEWIIVVVVVLVFGFALGRRSTGATQTPTQPPPPRRAPGAGLDRETLDEVRAYLKVGRKIDAIRIYRHATGVDLKTAKEDVEAMERGA